MAIERSWLPLILPENCTFSVPLELPPPSFDDATGGTVFSISFDCSCNHDEEVVKVSVQCTMLLYITFIILSLSL